MKRMLITALALLLLFSAVFVFAEESGWLDTDRIRDFFIRLNERPGGKLWVGGFVFLSLSLDLFLPVPSSIVMAFSGKFLGPLLGGGVSFVAAMLSAMTGYFLCRYGGRKVYEKVAGKDESEDRIRRWFERRGVFAIVLSRPVPMLTEILSCLAGLSKMRFQTFWWAAFWGTLPVCFLYAYVGSRGEIDDPWPALLISLIVPALGWFFARRVKGGENA